MTTKKQSKKKTHKGWALTKYDGPQDLRYDPDIGQFKVFATKAYAEKASWGKGFHVIKRVTITID